MPDTPPGHHDGHAAKAGEKIENEHQAQAGVLDAHLDGNGPAVRLAEPRQAAGPVPDVQGQGVVHKDREHDQAHIGDESTASWPPGRARRWR